MKIGYFSESYPFKRNIIEKVWGTRYQLLNIKDDKIREISWLFYRVLDKLKFNGKVKDSLTTRLIITICSKKKYNVDLIHSFNAIIENESPYVITFEQAVPRCVELMDYEQEICKADYNSTVIKYIKKLDSSYCKKIIAMSNCAKNICEAVLNDSGISKEVLASIFDKMTVLHPPQKPLVTEQEIRNRYSKLDGKICFIFIGRDFFRKGGKEIVRGLAPYAERCNLIIISSLEYDDYASHATVQEKNEMKSYIQSHEWIQHFESLENDKVLELCKTAHVGLLPTFADTYGYSTLEMQASGLPVVTTNVGALPEINDEVCGWIAHLPINKYGEALYSTEQSRGTMKQTLQRELDIIFELIFQDPTQLQEKAIMSLRRIEEEHSPLMYSNALNDIYEQSLIQI